MNISAAGVRHPPSLTPPLCLRPDTVRAHAFSCALRSLSFSLHSISVPLRHYLSEALALEPTFRYCIDHQ